jgi:hypothetical protein
MKVALPLMPGGNTGPNFNPALAAIQKACADRFLGNCQTNFKICHGAVKPWVGKMMPRILSLSFFISLAGLHASTDLS